MTVDIELDKYTHTWLLAGTVVFLLGGVISTIFLCTLLYKSIRLSCVSSRIGSSRVLEKYDV